ncbi:hypothetical protein [Cellulomonas composti]|uniref:Uncharacterized protein n=1 Tax=Cellulomonas composti TaxID=266130 RepID=A0A511JAB9_9CELL|nr:hypothetical protein [Cellulomonas composti]GEL94941.1 hypothetical protein CCO02nite_15990 [Cellulomonas composti]
MSVVDVSEQTEVAAYAARVRAALADLGPEQVEELTDGLEANLADALADERRPHGSTPADEFGPPAAYAAELRSSAGLEPVPVRRTRSMRRALGAPVRAVVRLGERTLARLRATRWWAPVEDFLVVLRPFWWVVRGWAVAGLALRMLGTEPGGSWWLPGSALGWAVLGAAVVASVQWGRGRWSTGRRWRIVLLVVSWVAGFAAVVLALSMAGGQDAVVESYDPAWYAPEDGVVVGGEYATNLFVYDAAGRPVAGAQVFDQAGHPVLLTPDQTVSSLSDRIGNTKFVRIGGVDGDGFTIGNAYPWLAVEAGSYKVDVDTRLVRLPSPDSAVVVRTGWPFALVPELGVPGAFSGSDEPATSPSVEPSTTPSVEPTGSPTGTPTTTPSANASGTPAPSTTSGATPSPSVSPEPAPATTP